MTVVSIGTNCVGTDDGAAVLLISIAELDFTGIDVTLSTLNRFFHPVFSNGITCAMILYKAVSETDVLRGKTRPTLPKVSVNVTVSTAITSVASSRNRTCNLLPTFCVSYCSSTYKNVIFLSNEGNRVRISTLSIRPTVGATLGAIVGRPNVGKSVGCADGVKSNGEVEGKIVGTVVVGMLFGNNVGCTIGLVLGTEIVGLALETVVGISDWNIVGTSLRGTDGETEGTALEKALGPLLGSEKLGNSVGV